MKTILSLKWANTSSNRLDKRLLRRKDCLVQNQKCVKTKDSSSGKRQKLKKKWRTVSSNILLYLFIYVRPTSLNQATAHILICTICPHDVKQDVFPYDSSDYFRSKYISVTNSTIKLKSKIVWELYSDSYVSERNPILSEYDSCMVLVCLFCHPVARYAYIR